MSLCGSMTNPPIPPWHPPTAANPSCANQIACTSPSNTPATQVTKNWNCKTLILHSAHFSQFYNAGKVNPITAMNQLFQITLKDEHPWSSEHPLMTTRSFLQRKHYQQEKLHSKSIAKCQSPATNNSVRCMYALAVTCLLTAALETSSFTAMRATFWYG